MLLPALIGPPSASSRLLLLLAASCPSCASSWPCFFLCGLGLVGFALPGPVKLGVAGAGAGVAGRRAACSPLPLRRRRRFRRLREAAAFAVVVDVVVLVGVPAGQLVAGGEEGVAAVGRGVDQVAFIAAVAAGDQEDDSPPESGSKFGSAALQLPVARPLELIDVAL